MLVLYVFIARSNNKFERKTGDQLSLLARVHYGAVQLRNLCTQKACSIFKRRNSTVLKLCKRANLCMSPLLCVYNVLEILYDVHCTPTATQTPMRTTKIKPSRSFRYLLLTFLG